MSAIGGRIRTLASRVAGAGTGAALVLALVAGTGAFAVTAVPRVDARIQTTALRRELATAGDSAEVVTGTSDLADLSAALFPKAADNAATAAGAGAPLTATQAALPESGLQAQLSGLGIPVSAHSADYWSGLVTPEHLTDIATLAPKADLPAVFTNLTYRSAFAQHATMTAGTMPDHATIPAQAGQPVTLDVAVSQATAAKFSLHLGEVVSIAAYAPMQTPNVRMTIVGIFQPRDPASVFWTFDPLTLNPIPPSAPLVGPVQPVLPLAEVWQMQMVVGADEVLAVQDIFDAQGIDLQYCIPLNLANVTGAEAQPLANLFSLATSDAVNLPLNYATGGQPATIDVSLATGPSTILTAFLQQSHAVGAVLTLVFGSLTALGAAVLLLCVLLLAERRTAELALLRARGASARQLALLGARVGVAAAVPVLLGALLAVAVVAGPVDPGSVWRPGGAILAIALLGPAFLAVRTSRRGPAGAGGRAPASGRNRARKIVAHAAVNILCIGAVLLERTYGTGSNDLLTSTAPFLLAVPIALVLHYLSPLVIRALTRIAARRRGVVPFIGLARASRSSAAALLPSFVLVLTLAVLTIGTMVHDTVLSGELRSSWTAVGADDLISSVDVNTSDGFSPSAVRALAATPGAQRSATADEYTTNDFAIAGSGSEFPRDTMLVVVDPAQYNHFLAGTPVQQLPSALNPPAPGSPVMSAAPPVPILASPAVAAVLGTGSATLDLDSGVFQVRVAATQTAAAALPGAPDFLIVPRWGLGSFADSLLPNLVLLDGPVDSPALTATVQHVMPGAAITRRADALSALTGAPFQTGTLGLIDLAMLAAVLLAVAVLLASLALAAASRESMLARLATMGLSRGQSNRLTLVENVPSIAGALLGGAVCAIAIGSLVGAGIDLSVFTGTSDSVPLTIDPWTVIAAGGVITATAALTLTGHTMAAHRRGVTAALRVGEQ